MKISEGFYKFLQKKGFNHNTLNSMNENELKILYNLIKEQDSVSTETKTQEVTTTKIPSSVAEKEGTNIKGVNITKKGNDIIATTSEGEMIENKKGTYADQILKKRKLKIKKRLKNKVKKIVEEAIHPTIQKEKLLMFLEQREKEVKPKVKPAIRPEKETEPWHPGKNPIPDFNPAPKAEAEKEKWIKIIYDIIKKG